MKFLTLLRKELRDSLPWIIFTIISLFMISWYMISIRSYNMLRWPYGPMQNGAIIYEGNIFIEDIMLGPAFLMFFLSILLGLALGFMHFWMPGFRGTWQYLMHRSVSRLSIINSKVSAAAIIMICLSLAWLLLAEFVDMSRRIVIPPESGLVRLGVFYVFLGFIVYMAIALCALTKARWYTTKLFSIFFGLIMYLIIISQPNIYRAFVISVLAFIILIVQLYQVFMQREF